MLKRILSLLLCVIVLGIVLMCDRAHALHISTDPVGLSGNVNDVFTIDVSIGADTGDDFVLQSFGLSMHFDALSVSSPAFVFDAGIAGDVNNASIQVWNVTGAYRLNWGFEVGGWMDIDEGMADIMLGRFTFRGIAPGNSQIEIRHAGLSGGGPWINNLSPQFTELQIRDGAPVPEPATLFLLGIGTIGLSFIRRKSITK